MRGSFEMFAAACARSSILRLMIVAAVFFSLGIQFDQLMNHATEKEEDATVALLPKTSSAQGAQATTTQELQMAPSTFVPVPVVGERVDDDESTTTTTTTTTHVTRIAVGRLLAGPKIDVYERSFALLKRYTDRHGYGLHVMRELPEFIKQSGRHPAWGKIPLYEQICATGSYDWVFLSDGDAIIMNMDVKLENLIAEGGQEHDFIVAADTLVLNSGNVLCKCSKWMSSLLKMAWRTWPVKPEALYENAALASVFGGCNDTSTQQERNACYHKMDVGYRSPAQHARYVRADPTIFKELVDHKIYPHVGWLRKKRLNSYADDYTAGDFIFHAAGGGKESKLRLLQQKLKIAERKLKPKQRLRPKQRRKLSFVSTGRRKLNRKINP
jgi:hypothetical protein